MSYFRERLSELNSQKLVTEDFVKALYRQTAIKWYKKSGMMPIDAYVQMYTDDTFKAKRRCSLEQIEVIEAFSDVYASFLTERKNNYLLGIEKITKILIEEGLMDEDNK